MICTRLIFTTDGTKTYNSYLEFINDVTDSAGVDKEAFIALRNNHIQNIREAVDRGYIKNLHNMKWSQEDNAAILEYFSDDLLLSREFQKHLKSVSNHLDAMKLYQRHNLIVSQETEPTMVIPFVDADRIVDEDL
jgi:hypothetical protein